MRFASEVVFNRNCSANVINVQAEYLSTDIEQENFDHTWDFPFMFSGFTFVPLHGTELYLKI